MAAFNAAKYAYNAYALNRPSYPPQLYSLILSYHKGRRESFLDLGCGHGVATRALSENFQQAIGIDPSEGMLGAAKSVAKESGNNNITFIQGDAESIPVKEVKSIDLVTSAQAAHWFRYPPEQPNVWDELNRLVRPGGTVAFWGYADIIFPTSSHATQTLYKWCYSRDILANNRKGLGDFWSFPGRSRIETLYGTIPIPEAEWTDVKWVRKDDRKKFPFYDDIQSVCGEMEHNPRERNVTTQESAAIEMQATITIARIKSYARTWSAYHYWKDEHRSAEPRSKGGSGDVIDWMFEEMAESEPGWENETLSVLVEYPLGILLARRV